MKKYYNIKPKEKIIKNIKKVKCLNLKSLKHHNEKDLICWQWQRSKTRVGYGQIRVKDKMRSIHRVSYEEFVGEIPKGKHVLHKCDNKPCCNPNHLFLGTHKDNMQDKQNKNRGNQVSGERHGLSKLIKNDIIEIRKLWKTKKYTKRRLGEQFNVSAVSISNIVNYKTWRII